MSFKCRSEEIQAEHVEKDMQEAGVQELVCYQSPELYCEEEGSRVEGEPLREEYVCSENLDKMDGHVSNEQSHYHGGQSW